MISGVILGSVFSCMIKENRRVKRKASKAVHAVGDFIEQVPSILR
ncbi:MAG: hypothetical protein RUMPE_01007 [Eubacteriales bacterium SKADARSKE-1]|nr:hypothetical protein [Eubacteriales bacterium SKADARSKE-1]